MDELSGLVGISLGGGGGGGRRKQIVHATFVPASDQKVCGACATTERRTLNRFTMFPTGANINNNNETNRLFFRDAWGTCSHRLTLFVFAMNMMMPPLDTEDRQKNTPH